jgi:hypothetical protein
MTFLGWYQIKLFIEHASGISMDALHILIGFAIFLLAAQLLRQGIASILPWLATLLLEIGNEAYDLTVEIWPDPGSQLGEGVKDIMLTMALPTLLMMIGRWHPKLLTREATAQLPDDQVPDRSEVLVATGASTGLKDQGQ